MKVLRRLIETGPQVSRRYFSKFNVKDALNLESLLTEEEILIQRNAAAYCQEKLMPRILMGNRTETFDREIFKEMGDLGLLGATIKG